MTLKVVTAPDWTQQQLDNNIALGGQVELGNFPIGTTLDGIILGSDWNQIQGELNAITSNYVPYSGATGNVDLGANELTAGGVIITSPVNETGLIVQSVGGTEGFLAEFKDTSGVTQVSIDKNAILIASAPQFASPQMTDDVDLVGANVSLGAVVGDGYYARGATGDATGMDFDTTDGDEKVFIKANGFTAITARYNADDEILSTAFNGNVGIGTGTIVASAPLHVSAGNVEGIRVTSSINSPLLDLYASAINVNNRNWRIATNYDNAGLFQILRSSDYTGAPTTASLTINNSGDVGIGNTAPAVKVEVVPNTNTDSLQIRRNSTTTNDTAKLGFRVSTSASSTNQAEIIASRIDTPNTGDTSLFFLNQKSGTLSESMRIDSFGNVGIGRTASERLTVASTVNGTDIAMGLRTLNAGGSSTRTIFAQGATTGALDLIVDQGQNGSARAFRVTVGAATNALTINSTSLVGIGIASATARLQVRGTGATSSTFGLIVENSAAAAPFSVRDDGNLYLGASATGAIISATDGTDSVVVTGNCGIRYRSALTLTSTGSDHFFRNYQGSRSATSGASRLMYFSGSFTPTSGTGTYEQLLIDGTINQTGGANGITRGVYINPTLTAAADYRAFDTTAANGFAYHSSGAAPSRFAGALTVENNLATNNAYNASTTTSADGRSISYRFMNTSADFLSSMTAAWRGGTTSTRVNLEFYAGGDSSTPPMAIRSSLNGSAIAAGSNIEYGWSSTTNSSTGAIDTALARNAAGVVEVNNGTLGTLRDLTFRNATATGFINMASYTVATLPAGAAGRRVFVTDALAPAFGVAVAGGGAVGIPVYHDGINWKVG